MKWSDKILLWKAIAYRRLLNKEEEKLKLIENDILNYLRRDLANVWTDEVGRDIRMMKTELERVTHIFKKLHFYYLQDEKRYAQEISHINDLLSFLDKVKPNSEWVKSLHRNVIEIISELEGEKFQLQQKIKGISRRGFIRKGIAVGVTAAIISKSGPSGKIFFDKIPEQESRQDYIDMIVSRIGKPHYVENVIYDNDGFKTVDYIIKSGNIGNALYEGEKIRIKKYANKNLNEDINKIVSFLYGTNDGRKFLMGFLKRLADDSIEGKHAITTNKYFGAYQLATGVKSTIFIYPPHFGNLKITNNNNVVMNLPFGENRMISTITHEFRHAKQKFEGIEVNGEILVDLKNLNLFAKAAKVFLWMLESDAYINGSLEFFRTQNRMNCPEYLADSLKAIWYLEGVDTFLKDIKDSRAIKFIEIQMKKYEELKFNLMNIFGSLDMVISN